MQSVSQFLCRGNHGLPKVHATEVELQQDLFKFHLPHQSFSSFGAQRNTGGVAIIVPRAQKGVHQRARFWRGELVPGRIQRLRISGISADSRPAVSAVIYNVHNYGIARQQAQSPRQRVARDVALANTAPGRVSIIFLGDFNIYAALPVYPRAPEIDRRRPVSGVAPHVAEAEWKRIFAMLLEVDNEMPTRCVTQGGQQPKSAQIDRIFLSTQSWEAIQWSTTASTPDLPEFLYEKGISDHAPVPLTLAPRPVAPPDTQRIPSFIFQDPDYARYIKNMASEADWHSIAAASKRRVANNIMKEVARMVRPRLVRNPQSTEARLMVFSFGVDG
eukprot:5314218-Pyramimonas_sp.AAC.1